MIDPKELRDYFQNIASTYLPLQVNNGEQNFYFIDEWEILSSIKTKLGDRLMILELPEGDFEGNGGSSWYDNTPPAVLLLSRVKDIHDSEQRIEALSLTKSMLKDLASVLIRDYDTPGHLLYQAINTDDMPYNKVSNQFGGFYGYRMVLNIGKTIDLTVDASKWQS